LRHAQIQAAAEHLLGEKINIPSPKKCHPKFRGTKRVRGRDGLSLSAKNGAEASARRQV